MTRIIFPKIPNGPYHDCIEVHCPKNPAFKCPYCYASDLCYQTSSKGINDIRQINQTNYVKGDFIKCWLNSLTIPMLKLIIWKSNKYIDLKKTYFLDMEKFNLILIIMNNNFFNDPDMIILYSLSNAREDNIRIRRNQELDLEHIQSQFFQKKIENMNFETIIAEDSSINQFQCPICINEFVHSNEKTMLNCGHDICYSCFTNYIKSIKNTKPCCSLCRQIITKITISNEKYKN